MSTNKQKIIILGGGFGGAYCAQILERKLVKERAEIILIDRNNYFLYYPLLIEAGTGSLEPRHAVVSIRSFLKHTTFIMGEVVHVSSEDQKVYYQLFDSDITQELECDQLVISIGSVTNLPDIPGLKSFGYEIKSLSDAVFLRDRAIQLLETANALTDPIEKKALLHFVVVGANFTGVEVAGEFDVFLKEASKVFSNVDANECKISLIELSKRILPALDEDLSYYAMSRLQKRGIDILLETTVKNVDEEQVILDDGEILKTHTVVWCAGIAQNPLIKNLPFPLDQRGYILCEDNLQVKGYQNVWAIGDCAVNPDSEGKPYPATAQHAVGQGKHLARNLVRVLQNKPTIPCNLSSQGALAALGCRTAVAKIFGIKLSGFTAWFLWRTVYLFKMPGMARRVRIALDWTMELLFKRDFVQLGVHRKK